MIHYNAEDLVNVPLINMIKILINVSVIGECKEIIVLGGIMI